MRGKILLLGILLSFKVMLSMDIYIPRNEREKNYLEKIRLEKLVLGTETDYFADEASRRFFCPFAPISLFSQ